MTRYYMTEEQIQAQVQRLVAEELRKARGVQTAMYTQSRGWVHGLVQQVVTTLLGAPIAGVVMRAVDYVWDWVSGWFSD